jgi:hypothetical protein
LGEEVGLVEPTSRFERLTQDGFGGDSRSIKAIVGESLIFPCNEMGIGIEKTGKLND